MPASRVCALVSGGVDSAALIERLLKGGRSVQPLYVRCGYRWEKAELRSLRLLLSAMASPGLKPLVCLDMPAEQFAQEDHWGFTGRRVPGARSADEEVFLPGRNILLLCAAAVFCLSRGRVRADPERVGVLAIEAMQSAITRAVLRARGLTGLPAAADLDGRG